MQLYHNIDIPPFCTATCKSFSRVKSKQRRKFSLVYSTSLSVKGLNTRSMKVCTQDFDENHFRQLLENDP